MNVLRLMAQDFTDDNWTLVQVMAWCRQATSHYLSQCWSRSMSPYGITRPQWVKILSIVIGKMVSMLLTHCQAMHICIRKLTIIGQGNGSSPGQWQAIIWTNAGILSIGILETYFTENISKIQTFWLKKMHLKTSAKWWQFCLSLNVLTHWGWVTHICVSRLDHHRCK